MPKYRCTIRRTTVSHEIVEITTHNAWDAARKATQYADEVPGARRKVAVVQTHDEDQRSTEAREVVAVKEV